jgi:predicted restriction endonuclease
VIEARERGSTKKILKVVTRELEQQRAFDSKNLKDARKRVLASIVRRQGQARFRKRLLTAYDQRCAITGCSVTALLEAAHLFPYKGPDTDHVVNGILLRADMHTLLDLNLIAIDDSTMTLRVSRELDGSEYAKLRGTRIRVPKMSAARPNVEALQYRLAKFEDE